MSFLIDAVRNPLFHVSTVIGIAAVSYVNPRIGFSLDCSYAAGLLTNAVWDRLFGAPAPARSGAQRVDPSRVVTVAGDAPGGIGQAQNQQERKEEEVIAAGADPAVVEYLRGYINKILSHFNKT